MAFCVGQKKVKGDCWNNFIRRYSKEMPLNLTIKLLEQQIPKKW